MQNAIAEQMFTNLWYKVKNTHPRRGRVDPEGEYWYTLSLTSALDGAGCQGHVPATLPPGKRPGPLCIGSWLGLWAALEWCGKSHRNRDSTPGPSGTMQVLSVKQALPVGTCKEVECNHVLPTRIQSYY
jgi:hypothetical protein